MFPYCQFKAGSETPETPRRVRACRAQPTFEVAETEHPWYPGMPAERGWFGLGDYCTGHAITVTAAKATRAMRPLPITVETQGKR